MGATWRILDITWWGTTYFVLNFVLRTIIPPGGTWQVTSEVLYVGAILEAWRPKMFHNFHFLKSDMIFGIVKAFSRIFDAISSEKSCSTLILFLLTYIECRTAEFFPPAESWLVNSTVRRGSRMQSGSPMANLVSLNTSHGQGYAMASVMPGDWSENLQLSQRNDWPELASIAIDSSLESTKGKYRLLIKKCIFGLICHGFQL